MLAACLAGGAAYTAWRVAQPEPETPESAMRQPADEEARPASESRDDPEAALEAIEAKREEAEKEAKEAGGEVEYDSAAGEYVVKDSSGKQVTSVPSGSGSGSQSSDKGSSSGGGSSAGGGSSTGGSTSSGGSSTGGGSGEPEKPAHVHSWVNDYESRYVVDEPAWDEPVYETVTWCNDCGMAVDVSHFEQYPHSYSVKQIQVDTIHHAEQGHYEDVCVGKHCSSCGAKG